MLTVYTAYNTMQLPNCVHCAWEHT